MTGNGFDMLPYRVFPFVLTFQLFENIPTEDLCKILVFMLTFWLLLWDAEIVRLTGLQVTSCFLDEKTTGMYLSSST